MKITFFIPGFIVILIALLFLYYRFYRRPKQLQKIYEQILADDTRNSIRDLKAIIIKQGGSIDAHFLLAECYRRERNYQMAIVEYRYCLNLNKKPFLTTEKEIREALVECYLLLHKEDEALQQLFELTRIEPGNAKNLLKIAKIFYALGNLEQAVTYFDRTVKADPVNIESLSYLGMIMFHANQIKEAIGYLTRAVKYDKKNYRAYYYLGRIYMDGRDFSKAITCFEASQASPEYKIRAFIQKGSCYSEMNEIENAINEYKKSIASAKGKDQNLLLIARYALGDLFEKNGKLTEAIEQWEGIYKTKPSYKDVAQKLEKYHALRADDNMKDFLVSPTPIFDGILFDIVKYLGYQLLDIKHIGTSIINIIATPQVTVIRYVKRQRIYIKVYRDAKSLGVDAIKNLVEESKALRCISAICISPVNFRSDAKKFTTARQIRLIGGDELATILAEVKKVS